MNDHGRAPAVRRAVTVLRFLADQGGASATAIADEFGLAKSSISDLVNTMLDEGLLQKREHQLALGSLFTELTAGLVGDTDMLDRFAIQWQRQRLLAEHTVSVQTIIGTQSLCAEVRLGMHLLPYTPRPGSRTEAWNGSTGEPALRCLAADDVRRTLASFAAFSPTPDAETQRARRAWIDRHARGSQRTPMVANTGNLELSVALTQQETVPPAVLTLHLPPRFEGYVSPKLRTAMEDFAAILTS